MIYSKCICTNDSNSLQRGLLCQAAIDAGSQRLRPLLRSEARARRQATAGGQQKGPARGQRGPEESAQYPGQVKKKVDRLVTYDFFFCETQQQPRKCSLLYDNQRRLAGVFWMDAFWSHHSDEIKKGGGGSGAYLLDTPGVVATHSSRYHHTNHREIVYILRYRLVFLPWDRRGGPKPLE